MTAAIITITKENKPKPASTKKHNPKNDEKSTPSGLENTSGSGDQKNKGKLMLDATVADAHIKYPTDLDLLNDSREKAEELIDILSIELQLNKKPRTYRKIERKRFLLIAKKKNKSKKEIRRGIKQQLGFLKRDIGHLHNLLDKFEGKSFPLTKSQQKYLFVIQHVLQQQEQMYKSKEHSCQNRIVSIHQPHVRPIVRGKVKANVEFGAKTGVSLVDGIVRIDNLSWEAYNESSDLIKQVEKYKDQHGFYPELLQVDRIYLNRDNRAWMKERNIRFTGKPLGRPQKVEQNDYQKRKHKKEAAERNQIEGKFGQGKKTDII